MQDKFSKYRKSGSSKLDKYKKSKGSTLSKAGKESKLGIKEKTEVKVEAEKPTMLGNVLIGALLVANVVVWILVIMKIA